MEQNKELALLLHLTSELYRKPSITFPIMRDIDIQKLIDLAARNNLLYYVASKSLSECYEELGQYKQIMEKIVQMGNAILTHMHESYDWMIGCLDKFAYPGYLIIKSYRGYNRLSSDIDLLVDDLQTVMKLFTSQGGKLTYFIPSFEAVVIKRSIPIHIHANKMIWVGGIDIMDDETLWSAHRLVNSYGAQMKIPNVNADFLIHAGHILFETFRVNLSNLLYLFEIGSKVNSELIYGQAKKYRWLKSLSRILKLIGDLHFAFYNEEYSLSTNRKHGISGMSRLPTLPMAFGRSDIMRSFIEKRPIIPSVNIKGVISLPFLPIKEKRASHEVNIKSIIKLILAGKRFHESEFVTPPEQTILNRAYKNCMIKTV